MVDDHSRYAVAWRPAPTSRRRRCRAAWNGPSAATACRRRSSSTTARPGATLGAALDTARRLAAQARHRGAAQPALSSAEPRQERTLPPHAEGRGVGAAALPRSGRGAAAFDLLAHDLQSRPTAPGSRTRMCRPAAIGRARGPCRTTAGREYDQTRSSEGSAPPRPTSASRAGSGRFPRPFAASGSPSGRAELMDNTASSSAPTQIATIDLTKQMCR